VSNKRLSKAQLGLLEEVAGQPVKKTLRFGMKHSHRFRGNFGSFLVTGETFQVLYRNGLIRMDIDDNWQVTFTITAEGLALIDKELASLEKGNKQ